MITNTRRGVWKVQARELFKHKLKRAVNVDIKTVKHVEKGSLNELNFLNSFPRTVQSIREVQCVPDYFNRDLCMCGDKQWKWASLTLNKL